MTQDPTPNPLGGLPAGARFDPHTGAELHTGDRGGERRSSYALQPGEPVASFNLITSLLPLASGTAPQTYRWALGLGVLIPVVAGMLGYLAFAFVVAALVVPIVYVVYLYDVNQWEDEPLPVVLGAMGLAAALGAVWTYVWHAGLLDGNATSVAFDGHGTGVRWTSLLVLVVLVPVVSLVLEQVGPILLARRPAFDDLIDGLTFGVASGAAFAAAETIVVNRSLFTSFGHVSHPDAGFWVSLILSAAIVKPIVYGGAAGLAVASFSGLGAGYDGFKPAYLRGVGEALLAGVLLQGGLFVAGRISGTAGAVVGLVWGALVAAAVVVRLRYVLHFAVLEAALEDAATGTVAKDAVRGTAFCPTCEMPLLSGAVFCVVCGTSVRSGSKVVRARNRTDDETLAAAAATSVRRPARAPSSPVVIGAIAATLLLGGVVGQAVAAAATDAGADRPPSSPPVGLDPSSVTGLLAHSGTKGGSGLPATIGLDDAFAAGLAPSLTSATTAGSQGTIVQLTDDILFLVPKGFKVQDSEPNFAQVFGQNGLFFAINQPKKTDLATMIKANLQGLQNIGIQQLAVSEPKQTSVANNDVAIAATLAYRGVLASQQGGTTPVEGFVYYFSLRDGTGVTAFALYGHGALDNKKLVNGYNVMLNTLVSTL